MTRKVAQNTRPSFSHMQEGLGTRLCLTLGIALECDYIILVLNYKVGFNVSDIETFYIVTLSKNTYIYMIALPR